MRTRRAAHDYGCVMAMMPSTVASKLIAFGAGIPEEHIYYGDDDKDHFGREVESHITVKFGVHTTDSERVRKVVEKFGPVKAKISGISVFDNDKYTVLKADIESDDLHKLNKLVSDKLKCTDTYPEYHPHATIAYLKKDPDNPDYYKEYLTDEFNGEEVEFDDVVFSSAKDVKTKLKIARIIQRITRCGIRQAIISSVLRRALREDEVELQKALDLARSKEEREGRAEWGDQAISRVKGLLRGRAKQISKEVRKEIPGNKDEVAGERRRLFVKKARGDKKMRDVAYHIGGPARQEKGAMYLIRDMALGLKPVNEGLNAVRKMAEKRYEEMVREIEFEEPMLDVGFTPDLMEFLPNNIVIKVNGSGELQEFADNFGRMRETHMKKARIMIHILKNYNAMIKEIKADLRSGDPSKQLLALMAGISMETGARPGKPGTQVMKRDPETGEKIPIETFGLTTLQPKHVQFIRDKVAKIKFPGKKGTTNIFEIKDSELLKYFKQLVDKVDASKMPPPKFLFLMDNGQRLSDDDLRDYFKSKWKFVRPTDFRKLRSTQALFDALKSNTKKMMSEIRKMVDSEAANLEEEVTQKIVDVLKKSFEKSQAALSHENVKTTIESYINPKVVLAFLANAGLEGSLKKLLLSDDKALVVKFNVKDFIDKAIKKAASIVELKLVSGEGSGVAELLEQMEEDLELL